MATRPTDPVIERALLLQILDDVVGGVVVVDASGLPLLMNRDAIALLPPAALQTRVADMPQRLGIHPAEGGLPVAPEAFPISRALQGEHAELDVFVSPPGSGGGRWLRMSARPLRSLAGIEGAVVSIHDISQDRRAVAERTLADRMAAMGLLAAGVAHEINNPLASVMANLDLALLDATELAKSMAIPAELLEQLHDARDGADRVRRIVRDLRVFSPGDQVSGTLDLHRVIDAAVRMAWNELRDRARLEKAYGVVPQVRAHESRLGQALLYLLVRAARSAPADQDVPRLIRISTNTDESGRACVTLSDGEGAGAAEGSGRQPGAAADPARSGAEAVTICRGLLETFGGAVELEAEGPAGTSTFRVILPAA